MINRLPGTDAVGLLIDFDFALQLPDHSPGGILRQPSAVTGRDHLSNNVLLKPPNTCIGGHADDGGKTGENVEGCEQGTADDDGLSGESDRQFRTVSSVSFCRLFYLTVWPVRVHHPLWRLSSWSLAIIN